MTLSKSTLFASLSGILFALTSNVLHAQSVPTITSFFPPSGPAGTSVTISGSNFDGTTPSNNVVYFGTSKGTVTNATASSITVTVPTTATYAPINVTTSTLTGYSTTPFMVTFTGGGSILSNSFENKVDFASGTDPSHATAGDLDGDGKLDIVVANYASNTISVYHNKGTQGAFSSSSFASKVDFTTNSSPSSVALSDLDRDGKLDILVTNYSSAKVSVFRNTSTSGSITSSSFSAKVDFSTNNTPSGVAVGDFDSDGKPDFAVTSYSSNKVSVFRNVSTTGSITTSSFSAKTDFATNLGPKGLVIADVDGDKKLDISVVDSLINKVSVLRNTTVAGSTTISFATKVDVGTGLTPTFIQYGDLDGNGKIDLAVTNGAANTVSFLRNTSTSGTVSFAKKSDVTVGTKPEKFFISDLDGDTKPDLAVANATSNNISVLRNTSTSSLIKFSTKVDFASGIAPSSTVIADFNNDSKPDIIATNTTDATISIFRNMIAASGPIVTTNEATNVNPTNATISGNVNPGGTSTTAYFEYGTTTDYGSKTTTQNIGSGSGNVPMVWVLTSLSMNVSYHVRVVATNTYGTTYGNDITFTTPYATPSAITSAATNIASTTADLNASVNPNGSSTTVYFQYGPTTTYGMISAPYDAGLGSSTISVSIPVEFLQPYVTYHYRVVAINSGGTSNGQDMSFTTTPALPSAQTGIVTNLTSNSATLSSAITPNGTETSVWFEYGTATSSYQFTTTPQSAGNGMFEVSISDSLINLVPDQTYYYRVAASNLAGVVYGLEGTFRTQGSAPISQTDSATNIRDTLATLNATINPSNYETSVWFEYGTTTSYGLVANVGNTLSGGASLPVSVVISNLAPNQTYHARVVSSNSFGTTQGSDIEFTTLSPPPSVTTEGAFDITKTVATIKAFVNSNGVTAQAHFEYGTTTTYDKFTTLQTVDSSSTITETLYNLEPNTTYHYRVVASNSTGLSEGNDLTFTTQPAVPVVTTLSKWSAAFGETITITGNYFNDDLNSDANFVYFGNVLAEVLTATKTSLTVKVPFGATFSYISVTANQLTGFSNRPFMPTTSGGGVIGDTSFSSLTSFTGDMNSLEPANILLADVNSDGTLDALIRHSIEGKLDLYNKTSDPYTLPANSFELVSGFSTGTFPSDVAVGDIDNDGKQDLVSVNLDGNSISVLKNTSSESLNSSSFSTQIELLYGNEPSAVALADINRDGKLDIIVANQGSDSVMIIQNNFNGELDDSDFSYSAEIAVGVTPSDVAIGDVDGDSSFDIVVSNYNSDNVSVLHNVGNNGGDSDISESSFDAAVNLSAGNAPSNIALGDINNDGWLDIIVSEQLSSRVSAFVNSANSSVSFNEEITLSSCLMPTSIVLSDVDGDGKLDIVSGGFDGSVSVFQNETDALGLSFETAYSISTPGNISGISVADLDSDGKNDIAFTNSAMNSAFVLKNNM